MAIARRLLRCGRQSQGCGEIHHGQGGSRGLYARFSKPVCRSQTCTKMSTYVEIFPSCLLFKFPSYTNYSWGKCVLSGTFRPMRYCLLYNFHCNKQNHRFRLSHAVSLLLTSDVVFTIVQPTSDAVTFFTSSKRNGYCSFDYEKAKSAQHGCVSIGDNF